MNGNEVISGKTNDLIEQNKLEDLFPKEILHFNKNLRQFTISKNN